MDYMKINKNEALNWLKDNLDEKRYQHSIGTAECAEELGAKYKLNKEKCYIAGLLHDCAKCFDKDKMLKILKENTDADETEFLNPKTWHAPVSAHICQTIFGVTDKEIISAIRWHTLGKLQMSDFEKVIFLADKIETKTRKKEYSQIIRNALSKGIDNALFVCYKETIKSLVQRELTICPLTIKIYNKMINVN